MDSARRAVLIAGLAAMTGCGRAGRAATDGASVTQPGNEPPPRMDGTLRFDDDSRAAAAEDFGHIVHQTPDSVLLPASEQDVATMIRWAADWRRQIAPRGQGHSVYGRAQVRDGIVIDMRQLRDVGALENDRIVVGAGATWGQVLAATLPRGLTPPVLTDYLELSVGGTL